MICLSFDTDHTDQRRMEEFLEGFPIPGVGTFFCTQPYEALREVRHEICPHPTLDPGTDWEQELDRKQAEFPDARGVRTHTLINSCMLSIDYHARGFRWVSAREEPGRRGIAPYREAWGVWHVPIYYMDTMDFSFGDYWPDVSAAPFAREWLETAVREPGLYVFDFHPIHLLLNSTSASAYLSRRDGFVAGEALEDLRCDGYGTADYYRDLIALMGETEIESVGISDALAAATREEAAQ